MWSKTYEITVINIVVVFEHLVIYLAVGVSLVCFLSDGVVRMTSDPRGQDFLRTRKILGELRWMRYNYLDDRETLQRIDECIELLTPIFERMKREMEER